MNHLKTYLLHLRNIGTHLLPTSKYSFLYKSWTGRLIIVNFVVFVVMSVLSGSIFSPTPKVLLDFGAKDPVGLAMGEIWRLVTPIFVHIGIIHFFFNTLGLYFIGFHLERLISPPWFLLVYIISGIAGNVSSSVFSVAVSAGASGALFGLLGCGYYIERIIGQRFEEMTGQRPPRGMYASMVFLNLAFGFLIPGIDNSAHLGGLLAGILITFSMINLRPNRLNTPKMWLGILSLLFLTLSFGVGGYFGTSKTYIVAKLESAGDEIAYTIDQTKHFDISSKSEAPEAIHYYSQAIQIDSDKDELYFKRGRLLLLIGETRLGFFDLRISGHDKKLKDSYLKLAAELDEAGRYSEAWQVKRLQELNQ